MNTHWLDWLFWIGGWTLAGGGALLLIWAIIGNRSRGRRRCRKCWYDMGSIEAVDGAWTCPECGKDAGREKLLLRPRRRWRWAVVACLVFAASYPAYSIPTIRRHGLAAGIPSSVLLLNAPIEDGDLRPLRYMSFIHFNIVPRTALLEELMSRAKDRQLSNWQYQALVDRFLEVEPRMLRGSLLLRDPWPAGVPLFVETRLVLPVFVGGQDRMFRIRVKGEPNWMASPRLPRWPERGSRIGQEDLGAFGAGFVELEGEILIDVEYGVNSDGAHMADLSNARTLWRGSLGAIRIAGTLEDLMEAFDSPAASVRVGALVESVYLNADGSPQLVMSGVRAHSWVDEVDWSLGFSAEVLVDEQVVARGSGLFRQPPSDMLVTGGWNSQAFDLAWTGGPVDLLKSNALLRLRGDPTVAVRDLLREDYWSGTVTVTIPPPQDSESIRDLLIFDGPVPPEQLITDR